MRLQRASLFRIATRRPIRIHRRTATETCAFFVIERAHTGGACRGGLDGRVKAFGALAYPAHCTRKPRVRVASHNVDNDKNYRKHRKEKWKQTSGFLSNPHILLWGNILYLRGRYNRRRHGRFRARLATKQTRRPKGPIFRQNTIAQAGGAQWIVIQMLSLFVICENGGEDKDKKKGGKQDGEAKAQGRGKPALKIAG